MRQRTWWERRSAEGRPRRHWRWPVTYELVREEPTSSTALPYDAGVPRFSPITEVTGSPSCTARIGVPRR